ncbi:uncharacterized protein SETTUDRAFT_23664 [Exserohilum turcica Et28A]|uniref:Uncharacterized protein n=1 Tax=Exserohilum turcicum (strain 28A) TaxID=671987 RepID=R0JIW0_EXST2|nr:uncharacterized protein SETTUDRAFT_23664 [Exserohilum turcica Et28A]EOA81283.1 hypothetical protein SETTUDRAFT_23664 [Exserohilum turcica Et28A]
MFQQYSTIIGWDNNALMRMYRQGLKPMVRRELMRSGANIDTLEELTKEAVQLDNELYELALEERLFNGQSYKEDRNDQSRQQQPRRSTPNIGRQRSHTPRTPGSYHGYESSDEEENPRSEEGNPLSDEEYKTPAEEQEFPAATTKHEKMVRFKEKNRPPTPKLAELEPTQEKP